MLPNNSAGLVDSRLRRIDPDLLLCSGIILALCLGHFLLRIIFSVSLGYDDSEQVLFSQFGALVYRPNQPPLYTWLLLPWVQFFGAEPWVFHLFRQFSIAALLLSWTLFLSWIFPDKKILPAGLIFALLLFPLGWVMQVNLTHTLLLLTFLVLSTGALIRLTQQNSRPYLWAALLGLFWAGGFLSKYSFGIFFGGQLLGLALLAPTLLCRHGRHLLVAGVIAGILTLPHILALFSLETSLVGQSRLVMNEDAEGQVGILLALKLILLALLEILWPAILLGAIFLSRATVWKVSRLNPQTRLITFLASWSLIVFLGILLFLEGDQVRAHWFLPSALLLLIPLFAQISPDFFRGKSGTRFIKTGLLINLAVMAVVVGREFQETNRCRSCYRALDYGVIAETLTRIYPAADLWISDHSSTAGGLVLQNKVPVATPEIAHLFAQKPERIVLVWQTEVEGDPNPFDPQSRAFLDHILEQWNEDNSVQFFAAPLRRDPNRFRSFASILLTPESYAEILEIIELRF
jgi:hypothetical protein